MLGLIQEGYGREKSIPQMILAGASVDDVFVIVMFSVFTGMEVSGGGAVSGLLSVPVSIALGIGVGLLCGWLMGRLFTACHIRDTIKLIVFLSVAFLLVAFEDSFSSVVPFSSLIAVMCAGIMLQKTAPAAAARMAVRYNKMWVAAEILLFVLVGATVKTELCADGRSFGGSVDFRCFDIPDGRCLLVYDRETELERAREDILYAGI